MQVDDADPPAADRHLPTGGRLSADDRQSRDTSAGRRSGRHPDKVSTIWHGQLLLKITGTGTGKLLDYGRVAGGAAGVGIVDAGSGQLPS
jgi:hypothetical protein